MKSEDIDEGVTLQAFLGIQLQPLRIRDNSYRSIGIGLHHSLRSRCFSCPRAGRDHDIVSLEIIDNSSLSNGRYEYSLLGTRRDGKEAGTGR